MLSAKVSRKPTEIDSIKCDRSTMSQMRMTARAKAIYQLPYSDIAKTGASHSIM
jgi:hypothetical protein